LARAASARGIRNVLDRAVERGANRCELGGAVIVRRALIARRRGCRRRVADAVGRITRIDEDADGGARPQFRGAVRAVDVLRVVRSQHVRSYIVGTELQEIFRIELIGECKV